MIAPRSRILPRLAAAWLAAGCSSTEEPAPGPAPEGPGHVRFEADCAPVSSVAFPGAAPGQTASMIVQVINDGTTDIALGAPDAPLSLDGPDAADFEILSSSCQEGHVLEVHGWCQLKLLFHPATTGAKQATLAVGAAGSLPLTATGVAPTPSFHADKVNITYPGTGFFQQILLRNDSTSTVDIGTFHADPPFAPYSTNCPASLTPGGACMVEVAISQYVQNVCQASELTTSLSNLRVSISFTAGRAGKTFFTALGIGSGGGTVTSAGGEINCPPGSSMNAPGCQASWWEPPPSIDLTATPLEGQELVGWMNEASLLLPCNNAPSCTVPIKPSSRQQTAYNAALAWFAPVTNQHVRVNIVGSGRVLVGPMSCDRSCTASVPPGTQNFPVQAAAGTFLGWSGDCTGAGPSDCQLGTILNDRTVTATFAPLSALERP